RIVNPVFLLCAIFRECAVPRLRSLIFRSLRSVSSVYSALCTLHSALHFGGHKAVVRPDPIPNSAVKHSLADGSGFIDSARVGRRQFFFKRADAKKFASAFFVSFARQRCRTWLPKTRPNAHPDHSQQSPF